MNEEELKQSLMDCCVVVSDALNELIKELQEAFQPLETISKTYNIRPPEEIKKQIKYEKNPMRLKQLNRELNDSYKLYRKRG